MDLTTELQPDIEDQHSSVLNKNPGGRVPTIWVCATAKGSDFQAFKPGKGHIN